MRLAKSAGISSPIAVAWKQLLDSLDELCPGNMQRVRQFKNRCKRRAIFTALKKANVLGMVAALECEGFLRQFAFVAQLEQGPSERSLFPRVRFVSSLHAQLGVCALSNNSSTKYSIHLGRKYQRNWDSYGVKMSQDRIQSLGRLHFFKPTE